MNLIVNNISIISFETKRAKFQNFIKGINVVTSSGIEDGNWVGKSCLLRSIFHTLGADGHFSDSWESEGAYVYLLDFNLGNEKYIMLRRQGLFELYDFKSKTIFSVTNRDELSKELVKIFNQKIYLKGHDSFYKLAQPVYNYLLNYIEQKEIHPTSFNSFKNLTAFVNFYDDLIYSHLGVHNDESNKLKEKQKQYDIKKKELENREKTLNEMNNQIENAGGTILDLTDLRKKLEFHEEKYKNLANKINVHKKKLNDAYNMKIELENLLKELDSMMKNTETDINKELQTHICPHCNSKLEDDQLYFFHRIKEIDNYGIQKLNVKERLNEVKRVIERESKNYEEISNKIKQVEAEIFSSSEEVKDGLKALGLKEVSTNIIFQIGKAREEKYSTNELINKIKKELKAIEKIKSKVDATYNLTFSQMLLKYPIKGILPTSIEKASSKFKVDGTHNNIATVMWLCSLLKTKYLHNPESTKYPLIFDTPNNANLDQDNEKKIFEIIFDNLPENGQIITSLVGFNENEYPKYEINKIYLNNEQYSLLNKEDYAKCEIHYKNLNLFWKGEIQNEF